MSSKPHSPTIKPTQKNTNNHQNQGQQLINPIQPIQPQQININSLQQHRIIYGNLQSILAAVNNNQGLNQQQQQHIAHQLATVSKPQANQPQHQFIQNNKPVAPIAPTTTVNTSNNSNNSYGTPESHMPTVFATTTSDGQIVFQTVNGNSPHLANNQMQPHFMPQNLMNMMQHGKPVPIFCGPSQFNQMIQQQQQQQQHSLMHNIHNQTQHQQHIQQHPTITQPVAASTPTPQDETILRQKLIQEEQKFQQLQQQLLKSKQQQQAIKPKVEDSLNQSLPVTTTSNTTSNQQTNKMDTSEDNTNLNTSDPNNDKKRGRPRLYVKNPLTGKSIKGKRLDGCTTQKPKAKISLPGAKKLLMKSLNKSAGLSLPPTSASNELIFPSPSTSVSSASVETAGKLAEESETSSTMSSSSDVETDLSGDEKQSIPESVVVQKPQAQVLTHVIEGFLIKESSKPFEHHKELKNAPESEEFKSNEIKNKEDLSSSRLSSKVCSKSYAKKLLKKQMKKAKKQQSLHDESIATTKENESKEPNKAISTENKGCQLEDATNKSKSKSKSHSHHSHKHKHRRHHGASSSSSSSRDKIRKKFKTNETSQTITTTSANLEFLPPIAAFSTVSISPQKLTYQPIPQPSNINNTFNASSLNQSYGSVSGDVQLPKGDPCEWSCEEVFEFVRVVAGINVAQVFKTQEVDGSALSLIRDDHLVNTMQIKLGPALKIMSKFNELKMKCGVV